MKGPRTTDKLGRKYGSPYELLMPPGQYRCIYVGSDFGYAYGRRREFCRFKIALDEDERYVGKTLVRFYNPWTTPFVPRTHNMFKDYYALIGLIPPGNVRPEQFLSNCEVLAEVVTVHDKQSTDPKRRRQGEGGPPYSRIDALLKITVGCPPCLQGRQS